MHIHLKSPALNPQAPDRAMPLTGKQLQEIQEALLDAYPSVDALRMMVRFELDQNLNAIAGGENLRVLIFNLLAWAEQQGCVLNLLDGACNQNKGNQAMADVRMKARGWLGVTGASHPPVKPGPASIDLFLCYSHRDLQATRQVQDILRSAGLSVWVDEGLEAGTPDWVDAIEDAIHQAQGMVVLLSPNARASKGVKDEVHYALLQKKRIFPVLLDGDAASVVPMSLSSVQWVDGRGRLRTCIEEELLPTVLRYLGRPTPQPPSPVESSQPAKQPPVAKAAPLVGQAESQTSSGPAIASAKRNDIAARLGIEWVTIPAGEFLMGSNDRDDDEKPQHKVYLPEYRIAKHPVTNAQYQAFVKATSRKVPEHWKDGKIPKGKEEHPVVYVSWDDALAYCKWAGVCLPTEAQWEKAARGTDGRMYPWGNEAPTKDLCNFGGHVGDTTRVGSYAKGASPYGVLDMVGNVWEWTSSLKRPYPYVASDGRESTEGREARVLRGGSWGGNPGLAAASIRLTSVPGFIYFDRYGFRVVVCSSP